MLKCKICGKEFEANKERHYIARDNGVTGIAIVVRNEEEVRYDAFDCPSCGCQVIAQERKRTVCEVCKEENYSFEYDDEEDLK